MRNLISALRVLAFCVLAVTLISCINNQSNRAQSPAPMDGLMSEPDVTVGQVPHGKVPSAKALEKEFRSAVMAAAGDRVIDADEFANLVSIASKRPGGVTIGNCLVRDAATLAEYCGKMGWKVLEAESENPFLFTSLNIYLENSKSMKGYIGAKGNGDFAAPIIALFHSGDDDTVYKTFYAGAKNDQSDAVAFKSVPEIDFKKTLTGGNFAVVKTSPLHNILAGAIDELVASSEDSNRIESVACVITDGILSGSNADIVKDRNYTITHLPFLEDCIRSAVDRAHKLGLHCLVYRLETTFDGDYYDYRNGIHKIKGEQRPYYMIMIGAEKNLKKIETKLGKEDNFSKYEPARFASYDVAGLQTVKQGKLSPMPNGNVTAVTNAIGSFSVKYDSPHVNQLNPVCFRLQLQLASLPAYYLDDDEMEDALEMSYVDVSSGQKVVIPTENWLADLEENETTKTFTLDIRLANEDIRKIGNSKVSIVLPGHEDNWYETMSSDDDTAIYPGDESTFALSYFMGGIMKGFGYMSQTAIADAVDFTFSLVSSK